MAWTFDVGMCEIARSEGIDEDGYRLVTNVNDCGQSVIIYTFTYWVNAGMQYRLDENTGHWFLFWCAGEPM